MEPELLTMGQLSHWSAHMEWHLRPIDPLEGGDETLFEYVVARLQPAFCRVRKAVLEIGTLAKAARLRAAG